MLFPWKLCTESTSYCRMTPESQVVYLYHRIFLKCGKKTIKFTYLFNLCVIVVLCRSRTVSRKGFASVLTILVNHLSHQVAVIWSSVHLALPDNRRRIRHYPVYRVRWCWERFSRRGLRRFSTDTAPLVARSCYHQGLVSAHWTFRWNPVECDHKLLKRKTEKLRDKLQTGQY